MLQPNTEAHTTSASDWEVIYSTVTAVSMKSGEDTFNTGGVFTTATHEYQRFAPTEDNDQSNIRLVAGGFEVHNDTPELYKGGSVTCYSQPNHWSEPQLTQIGEVGDTNVGLTLGARTPPILISDAVAYPGARTWAACDGCYVPLRLDLSEGNSFKNRSSAFPILRTADSGLITAASHKVVPHVANQVILNGLAGSATVANVNSWLDCPIETSGAFFTGLSIETVLTLDVRFITELAPTSNNIAMLSMCSPSAAHDPTALSCYTHCLQKLPPGVPVSMNEKGDFWRMVLKTAATAAPVVAPLAGVLGPEAALAAELASLGLKVASDKAEERARKKKQAKKTTTPAKSNKKAGPNNTYRK